MSTITRGWFCFLILPLRTSQLCESPCSFISHLFIAQSVLHWLLSVSCSVFLLLSDSSPLLAPDLPTLSVPTAVSLTPPYSCSLSLMLAIHTCRKPSDSLAFFFFQSVSLFMTSFLHLLVFLSLYLLFSLSLTYSQYFPVYFLLSLYLTGSPLPLSSSFAFSFTLTLSEQLNKSTLDLEGMQILT